MVACSVIWCDGPARIRGWCNGHYLRWRRGSALDGALHSTDRWAGRRWCSACSAWLDETTFPKNARSTDGLNCYCKACTNAKTRAYHSSRDGKEKIRARSIAVRYAITIDLARQLAEQARTGRCDACGGSAKTGVKSGHVDHNHLTGVVRGVLCHGCNIALGMVAENEERLLNLVAYLRAPNEYLGVLA